MDYHSRKFAIGETVRITNVPIAVAFPHDIYEVIRFVPELSGVYQYHLRSVGNQLERIAIETELRRYEAMDELHRNDDAKQH
jgi:hypothetical protein